MTFIVATNVIASRTPTDWNAARSCQDDKTWVFSIKLHQDLKICSKQCIAYKVRFIVTLGPYWKLQLSKPKLNDNSTQPKLGLTPKLL